MRKNGSKDEPMLISPDGNIYGPVPADLPPRDDYVGPAKHPKVTFKCGHKGEAYQAVSVYGQVITVSDRQANENLLCADCMIKKELPGLTRCGICGGPIVPGSSPALYRDIPGLVPDAKRIEHDGQTCVMGCARCAPLGVRPAGTWDGQRFVPNDLRRADDLMGLLEMLGGGDMLQHIGSPELCATCDHEDCPNRKAPYIGSGVRAIGPGRDNAG